MFAIAMLSLMVISTISTSCGCGSNPGCIDGQGYDQSTCQCPGPSTCLDIDVNKPICLGTPETSTSPAVLIPTSTTSLALLPQ